MFNLLNNSLNRSNDAGVAWATETVDSVSGTRPLHLHAAPPSDVRDTALWEQAWRLIDQHQPSGVSGQACAACGDYWPCEPYRHGQADDVASRRRSN